MEKAGLCSTRHQSSAALYSKDYGSIRNNGLVFQRLILSLALVASVGAVAAQRRSLDQHLRRNVPRVCDVEVASKRVVGAFAGEFQPEAPGVQRRCGFCGLIEDTPFRQEGGLGWPVQPGARFSSCRFDSAYSLVRLIGNGDFGSPTFLDVINRDFEPNLITAWRPLVARKGDTFEVSVQLSLCTVKNRLSAGGEIFTKSRPSSDRFRRRHLAQGMANILQRDFYSNEDATPHDKHLAELDVCRPKPTPVACDQEQVRDLSLSAGFINNPPFGVKGRTGNEDASKSEANREDREQGAPFPS